ncbi:MAG: winged helix-turn-helix transcriptional regulator [Candidatus Odinarchaeota archaeon]|nr:winged helix-turn-helix transcriptional regulator [Candidatus Odinarchaeota archaeon]
MAHSYLRKCEGRDYERRRYIHTRIDITKLPPNQTLYYCLKNRLRYIEKFNVKSPEIIKKIILSSITREEKLSIKELEVLKFVSRKPYATYKEIAENFGISQPLVHRIMKKLRSKVGLREQILVDYGLFKLKQFVFIFKTNKGNLDYILNNLEGPFIVSRYISESYYKDDTVWGVVFFIVPNQGRALRDFVKLTAYLSKLMDEWYRYEIIGRSISLNLTFFDGERWQYDDVSWAYWLYKYIKENAWAFEKPNVMYYSKEPMDFDRFDLILLSYLMENPSYTLRYLKESIEKRYNISRSLTFINERRKRILSRCGKSIMIDGLNLRDMMMVFIETDKHMRELMMRYFAQFPMSFISPTDEGIAAALILPKGTAFSYAYMFKDFAEEFENLIIIPTFRNLGSGIDQDTLMRFWDEKRKVWMVGDFFESRIKNLRDFLGAIYKTKNFPTYNL